MRCGISGEEVGFEIRRLDERGFELGIPRIDATRTGERIEVDFALKSSSLGRFLPGDFRQRETIRGAAGADRR